MRRRFLAMTRGGCCRRVSAGIHLTRLAAENIIWERIPFGRVAMEKAALFFKRIMLGLLLAVLAAALLLAVREGLTARSYLLALIAGALWAGTLRLLLRRRRLRVPEHAGLWVSLLCFAVNLAWVLAVRIEPFSDYETYWQCACALAAGTEIPTPWYIAMYPHILGTASFLSVFVRLFGASVLAATVVNTLLTALSCRLIYALTELLADGETALLASLLWCFLPSKLMLGSLVFSEPLYTCLILLFLWLLARLEGGFPCGGRLPAALACGAGLGLVLAAINIVRPIAAILIIALALWLVFLRGTLRGWKNWLCCLMALALVYIGAGKLWDAHVGRVLGMEPAAVPVYNIYVGFNEQTQGQWSAEDMDLLFSYLEQGMTSSEAQERMLPHLKERLASGIDFPRLFASKLQAFLGNDELGGYTYRYTRPALFVKLCMALCNVFYYGVLLAAGAGLWGMFHSRALGRGLMEPLFILGLTLAHMLVEVSVRYHYSLIPLFIIFAALGLTRGERSTP